ncbi:MAG: porin family protein [Vibrio sp.]|uniref:porin family protein n=1 Tax=Vibrio TaxID=662 RepID=UPI001ED0A8C5|nr:porin family protein [Vibrio sp.]NRB69711.1 porin family protein [Vibrio sp.]
MKKLLLVTALFSSVASANVHSGFYLGAGVGTTDFDDDGYFGDTTLPISTDSEHSYKIIAGYQFNRVVSLETQFTRYGDTNVKIHTPSETISGKIEHKSYTVAANLGYTFDSGVRPFAIVGLGSMDYTEGSFSDDGSIVRLGLGLEYTPPQLQGLSLRSAYEVDHYEIETQEMFFSKTYEQSVGAWYVAATYKF